MDFQSASPKSPRRRPGHTDPAFERAATRLLRGQLVHNNSYICVVLRTDVCIFGADTVSQHGDLSAEKSSSVPVFNDPERAEL
jgi:hypothetical protein